jgi:hypothetical protein
MTKARTKAARRRRANLISLPGGGAVASRPIGRERHHTQQPEPPADLVALTVRARLTGCTVEEARDILASEPIGRCIRYMRPGLQDRRDLMDVYMSISAAWTNVIERVFGLKVSAQSASLPMLPEPMQTDPSLRVDLRTADERNAAARRVWSEWSAAFRKLPPDASATLTASIEDRGLHLWDSDAHRPTAKGALAVKALAGLHALRRR